MKKRKSAWTLKIRLAHLKPFFGGRRMADIGAADIEEYQQKRRREKAGNGRINRELQVLRRMFNLARKKGQLLHDHVPVFEMLTEPAPRQGFFERDQFDAVLEQLPERLRNIALFGYYTGWRMGEITNLQWSQVNRKAGELRLDTSKNGEGRNLPYAAMPELKEVIDEQWKVRERLIADHDVITQWVFPKMRGARPGDNVGNFHGAWRTACKNAHCPGRLFHDFRRTVACNLTRRGVAEAVAMKITGHKTRVMFQRYNIASAADDALGRLSDRAELPAARATVKKTVKIAVESTLGDRHFAVKSPIRGLSIVVMPWLPKPVRRVRSP